MKLIASGTLMLLLSTIGNAQQTPAPMLDSAARAMIVGQLSAHVLKSYVFLETAKKIESDLRRRLNAREYDALVSGPDFARALTRDLQAISNDKHLRVSFSADKIPDLTAGQAEAADQKSEQLFFQNRLNSGFEKVERLEGNIGYIALSGFMDAQLGAEAAANAMGFVANTDALILDLRRSAGGSPEMVTLLSSYFFDGKPVHLNSTVYRGRSETIHDWTNPNVLGKKYGSEKPVFILVQSQTFSAPEGLAYGLQSLKRAIVVGEQTRGGAHIAADIRLTDHFMVNMPLGRTMNPTTNANWEGTGVTPDVAAPKELALKTAYILALTKAIDRVPYGYIKMGMRSIIADTQKEIDALKKNAAKP